MIYEYKGKIYPSYLKHGVAANFIFHIANTFCVGNGIDIGGILDCHFHGAKIINPIYNDMYDAMNLPNEKYDYIFSSHTLEHVKESPMDVLKYWKEHLKNDGVLFLYLPHDAMEYWRPQNNKKHKHTLHPLDVERMLELLGFKDVLCSERDMFWSFTIVGFNQERINQCSTD